MLRTNLESKKKTRSTKIETNAHTDVSSTNMRNGSSLSDTPDEGDSSFCFKFMLTEFVLETQGHNNDMF